MRRFLFAIFVSICVGLCSCSNLGGYVNKRDDVTVSVAEDSTFAVLSENPQTVKRGDDVSFEIDFIDGYSFDTASNGSFESGRLLIKNILFSQTVVVKAAVFLSVTLRCDENSRFSILSENPVRVKKGESAHFDVELEQGYKFESSENYYYEEGKLVFPNIQQSCDVSANAIMGNWFKLNFINNESLGSVTINPSKEYYDEGDIVHITITPKGNNTFICLSEEKSIHALNNSSKPFTFRKLIDLEMTKDFNLVVNYHDPEDLLMDYDLNGGHSFEGDNSILFDYKLFGSRLRPNSLVNDSYIYREGYYLESYNTEPDGSGERIGIGSRIDIDLFSNNYIKLYCQWIKENDYEDFEYESIDGELVITNYIGDNQVAVIPSSIGNQKVISIEKDAFKGANVEKVYLPAFLEMVEDDAFADCALLTELHYWTTLESITDNSFKNCSNLTRIAINCSTYPKYLNSFARGNYADKLDHAELLAASGPSILAVGSSTLQYNHSFDVMEETLNNSFSCYNLACLFAMPLQLMYDFALTLADDDDYVLIQLHETQASRTAPINTMVFAYLEGDLDRFLMLNYQNHSKYLLNSWSQYKTDTKSMADQMSYEYCDRGLKANGDYIWSSDESKITDSNKGSGTLSIALYAYNNFSYLANLHDFHNQKNTLLTFDTYNSNAVEDMTSFYNFESLIKTNFQTRFTILSDIDDSIIEGKYFRFEDNIHLNKTGGTNHSIFMANKIIDAIS